jgi:1-acyl-sn-glycerol-3-phosphate acyltransferase
MSDNQAKTQAASRLSDEELRQQLETELVALAERLQSQSAENDAPPYSSERLDMLMSEMLDRYPRDVQAGIRQRLRRTIGQDVMDPEVLKGAWYMLNYSAQYGADVVKRHTTGEYDTDEWGLDWEFVDAVRPFFTFLYKTYWRVETTGLENVPGEGRALLVANHSGQLPWDGMMVGTAVMTKHPSQRLVRTLYLALLPRIPFVAPLLTRLGQTLATEENATRLLEQEELVAVYPEGAKGTGKPFRDRYKLARFGRGGFVRTALNARAPIIPVSVVGSEETYITLAKLPTLSDITGIPYLPITLRFPWLGLLGVIPLPTKWYIDFGEPIPMDSYGPDAANNAVLVSQVSDLARNTVQEMLYSRLSQRRSVFFG